MDEQQFASFKWEKRWNLSNGPRAALTQVAQEHSLFTCLGSVRFTDEDAPHILKSLEAAVNLLKDHFTRTNAEMAARELMHQGKKIQAIKTYRLMMSDVGHFIGLKEAKDFVESLKL